MKDCIIAHNFRMCNENIADVPDGLPPPLASGAAQFRTKERRNL